MWGTDHEDQVGQKPVIKLVWCEKNRERGRKLGKEPMEIHVTLLPLKYTPIPLFRIPSCCFIKLQKTLLRRKQRLLQYITWFLSFTDKKDKRLITAYNVYITTNSYNNLLGIDVPEKDLTPVKCAWQ